MPQPVIIADDNTLRTGFRSAHNDTARAVAVEAIWNAETKQIDFPNIDGEILYSVTLTELATIADIPPSGGGSGENPNESATTTEEGIVFLADDSIPAHLDSESRVPSIATVIRIVRRFIAESGGGSGSGGGVLGTPIIFTNVGYGYVVTHNLEIAKENLNWQFFIDGVKVDNLSLQWLDNNSAAIIFPTTGGVYQNQTGTVYIWDSSKDGETNSGGGSGGGSGETPSWDRTLGVNPVTPKVPTANGIRLANMPLAESATSVVTQNPQTKELSLFPLSKLNSQPGPTPISIPDQDLLVGKAYELVHDAFVNAVTYKAENLPPGISYSSQERKFYGTPTTARDEKWQATLTAYNSNSVSTTITVGFKVYPQAVAKSIDFVYFRGAPDMLKLYLFGSGLQGDLLLRLTGINGNTYNSGLLEWTYDPGKYTDSDLFTGAAPFIRLFPSLPEGDYQLLIYIKGTDFTQGRTFTYDADGKGRIYPSVSTTNILTGKPSAASSVGNGTLTNANDGSDLTSWQSVSELQPCIQFDLGKLTLLDGPVRIKLLSGSTTGLYAIGFNDTPPSIAAGSLGDAISSARAVVKDNAPTTDGAETVFGSPDWLTKPVRYIRIQRSTTGDLGIIDVSAFGVDYLNDPPQLAFPFGRSSIEEGGSTVNDLSQYIVDPQGEAITYTAKLKSGLPLPSFMSMSAGGKLTITNAVFQGSSSQNGYDYDIVITGADPGGAQVSGDYKLTVYKIDVAPDEITYAGYSYDINRKSLTPQFTVTGGNWLVSVRGVGNSYNELGHASKTGAFVTERTKVTYNREGTPFLGVEQGKTYEIEYYQVGGASLKRTETIPLPSPNTNFDSQLHPTTSTGGGGGGGETPTGDTLIWAAFHPDNNNKTLTPIFSVSGGVWAVSIRGVTNTGYSELNHAAIAGNYTSETRKISYNREAGYFSGFVSGQTYEIEYFQPGGGTSKKIQFVFPTGSNNDIELTIPGGGTTDPGPAKPTISSVYTDSDALQNKHFIIPRAEATGDVQFRVQRVDGGGAYDSGWQTGVKGSKSYYEWTNSVFMLDGQYTVTARLISDPSVTRTSNSSIVTFIRTIAIAPNSLDNGVCRSVICYVELSLPTGKVERAWYLYPADFLLMGQITDAKYTHSSGSIGGNAASGVEFDSVAREFKFRIQGSTNPISVFYKRNGDAIGTKRVVYSNGSVVGDGGSSGGGGGTVTPPVSNFVQLPQVAIPTGTWKISNGVVEVGFNREFGGSIMHLSKAGGVNLVNNPIYPNDGPDKTGRQVQTARYRSPFSYRQGNAAVNPQYPTFTDNLLEGGSSFHQPSEILYRGFKDGVEYQQLRPKQWALSNAYDNTIFEKWTWLEGNAIKVHMRVTDNSANNTTEPLRPLFQEMPCMYLQGNFKRGVVYTGGSPWSNAGMETIDLTTIPSLDNNITKFGSETWAALSDPNTGLTVGLYTPKNSEYRFSYAGNKDEPVVENQSGNSGYLAASAYHIWDKKDVYEWDYSIVIGDSADAVRSKIASFPRPNNKPQAVFNNAYFTRQGWTTYFCTDKGMGSDTWRVKNHETENGSEAHNPFGTNLLGPPQPFQASEVQKLYVKAASSSSISVLRMYFSRFDMGNILNPTDNSTMYAEVSMVTDGQHRVYELNMAGNGNWSGWIARLAKRYVNDSEQDIDIKWIDTVNRDAGTTNQAPTISFLTPASGTEVLSGATVDIEFNANDADGSVSQVETFINGAKIGTDLSAPWKISPSLAGYAAGDYEIKGIVTDNRGATAEVKRTIKVKSTTPPPQQGTQIRRLVSCQRGFGAGDIPDMLDFFKGFYDRGGNGIQLVIKSTDWKRGERFYDSVINQAVGRGASIEICTPMMYDRFDLPSWWNSQYEQMMGRPNGTRYIDESYAMWSFYYFSQAWDGNNPGYRWEDDLFGTADTPISRYGSVVDYWDTGTGQAMELGFGVRAANGQLVSAAGYEDKAKLAYEDDLIAYYGGLGAVNAALLPGTNYNSKSDIMMPYPGQYFEAPGRHGQALLAQREGRVRMVQQRFEQIIRSRLSSAKIQVGMGQTQSAQGRWYATQNADTLCSTANRAIENFTITDNWLHMDRVRAFAPLWGVELDGAAAEIDSNGNWRAGMSDWDVQYRLRDADNRNANKINFFAFRNNRAKIYWQTEKMAEYGFPGSPMRNLTYSGTAHVYATQQNGNGDANGNSNWDTNWRAAGGPNHPVNVVLHEIGYPMANI